MWQFVRRGRHVVGLLVGLGFFEIQDQRAELHISRI
jgi:hypothetical protein